MEIRKSYLSHLWTHLALVLPSTAAATSAAAPAAATVGRSPAIHAAFSYRIDGLWGDQHSAGTTPAGCGGGRRGGGGGGVGAVAVEGNSRTTCGAAAHLVRLVQTWKLTEKKKQI